jgi:rod shape-determining protein MreD
MLVIRQILIVVVLLAAQVALGPLISVGQIQPNFLAIYVIYWTVRRGPRDGIWLGFAIGIVQDIVTTQFLGISPLSFAITCFIIGKLCALWPASSRWSWMAWLLGGAILHGLVYYYFYAVGTYLSFGMLLWNYALPTALYTALLGALWSLSPWWKPCVRRG